MVLKRLSHLAVMMLSLSGFTATQFAQVPASAADPAPAGAPIYLPSALLTEAEKPSVEAANFIDPGPERSTGWALRDLRDYLQRMTGNEYPFAKLDGEASYGIFVGNFDQVRDFKSQLPATKEARASSDPEAFAIEVQGQKLFILGKSKLGVMAAVYTFLDKLGCKWFAPGALWENVPRLDRLTFDDRFNIASAGPSYQFRWFAVSWGPDVSVFRPEDRGKQAEWMRRNRQGGWAYTANFHNDPAMVPPALFDARPELFALVKGKRNPYALSRANPDAVALATQAALKYFNDHDGQGSFYNSFSVETNDGSPACEWSLAKIGKHTATDLNYWFANQIATGIEAAGLNDRWVGMCSYSDHATLPSFDLAPRVAVNVTTGLAFSDTMGPIDLTVEQRIEGLRARKCQRIGIYDYPNLVTWSLERPGCAPASKPLDFAAKLRSYHSHGASTYIGETSDSWIMSGAGHYVGNRLLWKIDADAREELAAYYQGAFGPAADEIKELYENWEHYIKTTGVLPRMSRADCARWHRLIAAADRKARGDSVYEARVNAVKRYYLFLNLTRELEIEVRDERLPSKTERYSRLLRYVAANRGDGVFHGYGLFYVLMEAAKTAPGVPGVTFDRLDADLIEVSKRYYDEAVWKPFSPIGNARIDEMFAEAALTAEGGGSAIDPRLVLFPADAQPPAELKFPKLHGPPIATGPRQYVLRVVKPVAKLTFQVVPGSPLGGGLADRTCTVTSENGDELKSLMFKATEPVTFELADIQPGWYTAVFPDFGAEEVTVAGGGAFGAVRAFDDTWGYNPMRRSDATPGEAVRAYFIVPAGEKSLMVRLTSGLMSIGFEGGEVIASAIEGGKPAEQEVTFSPSSMPRIAYVEWGKDLLGSEGMKIEGVTLYTPDRSYVAYEALPAATSE